MVSELTNASCLSPELLLRLQGLPAHLAAHLKGQDHALPRVASVLIRGELGLADPRRPKGSLLLVGPTGVGKTECTQLATAYLFGARPLRFDMSEYQLQKSVDRLIGENKDDPGLLKRAIATVKQGTLLFDEVEKAHPLVLDLFLQILEDGRLTLTNGETLDLHGFYIVFTSNIGSSETMRMESAPFASVERTVLMRMREQLRPELVGRISETIVFARLGYATQRAICEAMVEAEVARLGVLGHHVTVHPTATEFLVREGYHRLLGARPMRAAVERHLQGALAAALLDGRKGSVIQASPDGSGLLLKAA